MYGAAAESVESSGLGLVILEFYFLRLIGLSKEISAFTHMLECGTYKLV